MSVISMTVDHDKSIRIRSESQEWDEDSGSMDVQVLGELTLPVETWLTKVFPAVLQVAAANSKNWVTVLVAAESGETVNPEDLPGGPVGSAQR